MAAPKKKNSESKCNSLFFKDLCTLFELVDKTSGSKKKLDLIFSDTMKRDMIGTEESMFPLMRLLLPLNDDERGKYGLKQVSVAKAYVNCLQLKKTSDDATRLIHWKDPSNGQGGQKLAGGDFCEILEEVLKERVRSTPSDNTVGDINLFLDSLAAAVGERAKTELIRDKIMANMSANEQKWLMRIVFQDLKIHLKHEQVLGRFYKTALQRYNECTSLRTVCEEEGCESSIQSSGISIFNRISPMLAKGFMNSTGDQVLAVEAAMKGQPFVMDLKLDGERMLCHIQDEDVMLFTRNGSDYTHHYAPLAQAVRRNVLSPRCVLDGEVLAWDNINCSFMPFGNNATVGRNEREHEEAALLPGHQVSTSSGSGSAGSNHTTLSSWMTYIAFDIIYLEGAAAEDLIRQSLQTVGFVSSGPVQAGDLTALPLLARRELLRRLMRPVVNRFEMVQHRVVNSLDFSVRQRELQQYFTEVVDAREEGLVIKNLNSSYVLGDRSRSTAYWVKMKPEYGQTDDLDLIVLGAYYGESRSVRGDGVSRFLCGVRREDGSLESLCKVGTGYTFADLQDLRSQFQDKFRPWDAKNPPDFIAHWSIGKADDRPHVYLEPEDSFIIQLKCAEIVESTQFSAGVTCRFPRVQRFRFDKPVSQAMTLAEVLEIRDKPRMSTSAEAGGEIGDGVGQQTMNLVKKRKAAAAAGKKTTRTRRLDSDGAHAKTVDHLFAVNKRDVSVEGNIFDGCVYCVIGEQFLRYVDDSPVKLSRDEIIGAIRMQGGTVVANPLKGCNVIALCKCYQVDNLVKKAEFDVMDGSFITDSLSMGKRLPLAGRYYLGCCSATRSAIRQQEDMFGMRYDAVACDVNDFKYLVRDGMSGILSSLQLKHSKTSLAAVAAVQKRGSASKSRQLKLSREELEEINVLNDHSSVQSLSWRSIISNYLADECIFVNNGCDFEVRDE